MRAQLIAGAFSALNAGDVAPFEALLDPQARWIAAPGPWQPTPT